MMRANQMRSPAPPPSPYLLGPVLCRRRIGCQEFSAAEPVTATGPCACRLLAAGHPIGVVPPEALLDLRAQRVVASVAGVEARTRIRTALGAMGYVELRDFVCAA